MAVSLKELVDSNKHHFVKIIGEIYEYHLVSPWSFLHGQDCRLNICRNLHCINKVAWTRSFLFFNNDSLFAGSDVRLTFFSPWLHQIFVLLQSLLICILSKNTISYNKTLFLIEFYLQIKRWLILIELR